MDLSERKRLRIVLAIALVALLVRLYTWWAMAVVSKDALWFVTGARAIAAGDFVHGWLGQDQHPLCALFVWLGGCLTGDWLAGGRLANVIFGALAVLPVYGIARLLFGHRVGLIAAWLLAFHVHAARYSGDVLSEPSYFFFFLCASFFGLLGLRTDQKRYLAFCGASSGLAYLVRPEGLGVVLVAAAWAALRNIRGLTRDWRARAVRVLVLALAAGVFAWPYMIYIGRLTKKKTAVEIIEAKPPPVRAGSVSAPGHSHTELFLKGGLKLPDKTQRSFNIKKTALYDLASKLVSAVTHALAPLVLIGLVWGAGRERRGRGEWFVASMVLLYLFMLYGLRASSGYVGRRHATPVALLLLPWAGAGVAVVAQWLTRIPKLAGRPQAALAGVMVVMTIVPAVRLAEPRSADKVGVAQAGIWIREHSFRPPKVITLDKPRVAVYAYSRNHDINRAFGDRVLDPARVNYQGVLAYALKIGATHVAFDRNFIEELVPGFTADLHAAEAKRAIPRLAVRFRSKVKQRDSMPNLFVCEVVRKESDGGR